MNDVERYREFLKKVSKDLNKSTGWSEPEFLRASMWRVSGEIDNFLKEENDGQEDRTDRASDVDCNSNSNGTIGNRSDSKVVDVGVEVTADAPSYEQLQEHVDYLIESHVAKDDAIREICYKISNKQDVDDYAGLVQEFFNLIGKTKTTLAPVLPTHPSRELPHKCQNNIDADTGECAICGGDVTCAECQQRDELIERMRSNLNALIEQFMGKLMSRDAVASILKETIAMQLEVAADDQPTEDVPSATLTCEYCNGSGRAFANDPPTGYACEECGGTGKIAPPSDAPSESIPTCGHCEPTREVDDEGKLSGWYVDDSCPFFRDSEMTCDRCRYRNAGDSPVEEKDAPPDEVMRVSHLLPESPVETELVDATNAHADAIERLDNASAREAKRWRLKYNDLQQQIDIQRNEINAHQSQIDANRNSLQDLENREAESDEKGE